MKSKKFSHLIKFGWIMVICTSTMKVYAQDDNAVGGEVQSAEIVIEKDRKIELSKEKKLFELINWTPEREWHAIAPIEFKTHNYPLIHQPIDVSPTQIAVNEPEKTYHRHIKTGFGNYQSPLIDINMSTAGNPNQQLGVNLKHLSFEKGEVDGKNSASATTEIGVYAIKITDQFKVKPRLDYRYDRNYWYGYTNGTVVENRDDIKRANQFLDFSIDLSDNNRNDDWQTIVKTGYRNFTDNQDNKENTFDFDGSIVYQSKYGVDVNLALSKFEGTTIQNRSYYRVLPYYKFKIMDINLTGGLSVNGQNDVFGQMTQTKIFPYAKAIYDVNDNSQVYAILDAGYQFNSMYDFSKQMPYLSAQVIFPNTEKLIDLSIGYNGRVTNWWAMRANLGLQSLRNLPTYATLFVPSQFDLYYDTQTTELVTLGFSSTINLNTKNSLELGSTFYDYKMGEFAAAFGRPSIALMVKGNHGIAALPLTAQWQLTYVDGIKGYATTSESPERLSPIVKLDLNLHYQINEHWGAFVSGENLLGQSYARYPNYTQRKLAVKIGVTYRF